VCPRAKALGAVIPNRSPRALISSFTRQTNLAGKKAPMGPADNLTVFRISHPQYRRDAQSNWNLIAQIVLTVALNFFFAFSFFQGFDKFEVFKKH
jgi:hypothetical protein